MHNYDRPEYMAAAGFVFTIIGLWIVLAVLGAAGILYYLALAPAAFMGWVGWTTTIASNRQAGLDDRGHPKPATPDTPDEPTRIRVPRPGTKQPGGRRSPPR